MSDKRKSGMHPQPTVAPALENITKVHNDGVLKWQGCYATTFFMMIFDLNENSQDRWRQRTLAWRLPQSS